MQCRLFVKSNRNLKTQKYHAFTLIELLIVVAIIGILAAIAVPNFLNAQIRAKTARTMADMKAVLTAVEIRKLDTNWYLTDGNDCDGSTECCHVGSYFGKRVESANVTMVAGQTGIRFNGQIYLPLTTPISYMSSIPVDPFADGLFYSYEDWGCSNKDGVWAMFAAAGPDGDSGDWHRSLGPTMYYSTNGVVSDGDIWYTWKFRDNANSNIFDDNYKNGWSADY